MFSVLHCYMQTQHNDVLEHRIRNNEPMNEYVGEFTAIQLTIEIRGLAETWQRFSFVERITISICL